MKTLSYVLGVEQEIEIGSELYFGQLWDGNFDGEEILQSGSICINNSDDDDDIIVDFEIIENNEDILQALVCVTGIS